MLRISGGKWKNRTLIAPKSRHVRPTTAQLRQSVFNICQQKIEGSCFLDLCAGSGAMGLEALSRGSKEVFFVESLPAAFSALRANILSLVTGEGKRHKTWETFGEATLYKLDALSALALFVKEGMLFDLVYLDPPYRAPLYEEVLDFFDTHPLLRAGGTLFVEAESLVPRAFRTLQQKRVRRVGSTFLYEYQRVES